MYGSGSCSIMYSTSHCISREWKCQWHSTGLLAILQLKIDYLYKLNLICLYIWIPLFQNALSTIPEKMGFKCQCQRFWKRTLHKSSVWSISTQTRRGGQMSRAPLNENDFIIDTCRFRRWEVLGEGIDRLAQGQDKVSKWKTRSWFRHPGHSVVQH